MTTTLPGRSAGKIQAYTLAVGLNQIAFGGVLLPHRVQVRSLLEALASGFEWPGVSSAIDRRNPHGTHFRNDHVGRLFQSLGHSGRVHKVFVVLIEVSPRSISTGHLNVATMLTLPAYQRGGLLGGLTYQVVRNLILEQASRLDAFSGYPFRTLTSRAFGRTTGTLEVRPSRSLVPGTAFQVYAARRIGTEPSHDVLNPACVPL